MKLIVGLGNPGVTYQNTRHNMGFMVIDALAKTWKITSFKEDFQGEYALVKAHDAILFKPNTFMNLSGHAVQAIMTFYKIPIEDVVIIYDDLAFEPGAIRLRLAGSSGSHNGIGHIIEQLKTQAVKRIRIGIGPVPKEFQGRDYVLAVPNQEEFAKLNQAILLAVKAIEDYLVFDFPHAMSRFNRGASD
jgi:peptidyl-tRNA hydrolase, PTH1 family